VNEVVLDASAILVLLNSEPGAEVVEETLPGAITSTVNLSEAGGDPLQDSRSRSIPTATSRAAPPSGQTSSRPTSPRMTMASRPA
jgi:PIN domain nuclease of toxin-antitoxin system